MTSTPAPFRLSRLSRSIPLLGLSLLAGCTIAKPRTDAMSERTDARLEKVNRPVNPTCSLYEIC